MKKAILVLAVVFFVISTLPTATALAKDWDISTLKGKGEIAQFVQQQTGEWVVEVKKDKDHGYIKFITSNPTIEFPLYQLEKSPKETALLFAKLKNLARENPAIEKFEADIFPQDLNPPGMATTFVEVEIKKQKFFLDVNDNLNSTAGEWEFHMPLLKRSLLLPKMKIGDAIKKIEELEANPYRDTIVRVFGINVRAIEQSGNPEIIFSGLTEIGYLWWIRIVYNPRNSDPFKIGLMSYAGSKEPEFEIEKIDEKRGIIFLKKGKGKYLAVFLDSDDKGNSQESFVVTKF
jgi:hypothetical protein